MRALVAYGTKYGSTAKVAEAIASVLIGRGVPTEVINLDSTDVDDVSQFDLVVLGSAIIMGRWTKGARAFLDRHHERLAAMDVAMFACCGDVLAEAKERRDGAKPRYLDQVASEYGLHPLTTAILGGELDFSKYGFLIRSVLKNDRRYIESGGVDLSKPFDYRNWDVIRTWAGSIADEVVL